MVRDPGALKSALRARDLHRDATLAAKVCLLLVYLYVYVCMFVHA